MTLVVIPAVDVSAGQAVRLVRGEAGTETDYGAPLDAALDWQRAGAPWLHLVDLDAAFGRGDNRGIVSEVVRVLDIPVEVSGGVRDDDSLRAALDTGAERVVVGTAALEDPAWVRRAIERLGERLAVALDVRGTTLAARGWTRPGGELGPTLARLEADGCARYVVTDVHRDGTLTGPNLELLREVTARTDRPVIASGGVSSLDDLRALAALGPRGVEGVIVGKALYAGAFTLPEALTAVGGEGAVTLAVRVVPCLDVADGRVVKGTGFVDLRDAGDPVELAARYDAEAADELVFLDITASPEGRQTTYDVVRRTAEQVFIPLTVGGGVRRVSDVDALLRAGADKVAVNTAAVAEPALVSAAADRFGSQCVVLAIDARLRPDGSGWEVVTHGGRTGTGRDLLDWAAAGQRLGAGEILLTSMDRDGTGAGFDTAMLAAVREVVSVPIIASGGRDTEHFPEAVAAGADACLAAGVFHFGRLSVADTKAALRRAGYDVR